jgi:hypothetical protein
MDVHDAKLILRTVMPTHNNKRKVQRRRKRM